MKINVFFYGLFMDEDLLRSKGIQPENVCIAKVYEYALRIGERATLIRKSGFHVYGVLMPLTYREIDLLYADESVKAYRPEPVIAHTKEGKTLPALCFNLIEPNSKTESNPEYAAKLKSLAAKIGFPKKYIDSIG